jgi:SAM-dependent methyltransferase
MNHLCPACSASETELFFEITDVPISIAAHWPSASTAKGCTRGRLELFFCDNCGFVWNRAFDASLVEYSQHYDNSLDYSSVFQDYAKSLARRLVDTYDIRRKQVIEVGCGKGHFLTLLCEEGDNCGLGFDPSHHGGRIQSRSSVNYIQDFYGPKYTQYHGDLICCRHVLEHVPDPRTFLLLVRQMIDGNSATILYFEVPNLRFILEKLSTWDVIYEHCNYLSTESLGSLFRSCEFNILRLEETYGGQFISLEATVGPDPAGCSPVPETLSGLVTAKAQFSQKVANLLDGWETRLAQWRRQGQRVVVWGAGAKAVSFLNFLKITDTVPYAVDINPYKQGRYLPGTGQRVVAPEFLSRFKPDAIVLMNPMYRQEVERRLKELGLAAEIHAV